MHKGGDRGRDSGRHNSADRGCCRHALAARRLLRADGQLAHGLLASLSILWQCLASRFLPPLDAIFIVRVRLHTLDHHSERVAKPSILGVLKSRTSNTCEHSKKWQSKKQMSERGGEDASCSGRPRFAAAVHQCGSRRLCRPQSGTPYPRSRNNREYSMVKQ